jgi:hypothetical protein
MLHKVMTFASLWILLSCGARTALSEADAGVDASSPDATAGSGGFAGSGGTAGSGGAAGTNSCPALVLKGSPVELKGDAYVHATRPLLAPASDDGTLIAIAAEGYPVESPGPTGAHLQFVAFHPWGEPWPPYDFGNAQQASTVTGMNETLLARGLSDGVLAMAWPVSASPPDDQSHGVLFVPDFSPYSGNWSTSAVNAVPEPALSERPAFLTRAGTEHLVGYFQTAEVGGWLRSSVMPPGSPPEDFSLLACGVKGLSAAAKWNGSSVLLAASSSRTPLGCQKNNGPSELANHVTLVARSLDGTTVQVLHDTAISGDAVSFVDVELHDSGEWLVYQYMGLNAEVQPPPMVMRLDATGGVKAGPVSIDDASGQVAIARMGNRLAVAWLTQQGARLEVRLLSEDGSMAASTSLDASPGMPHGVPSLIGSPDSDKLLVAWSVAPMGGGMIDITWVARLDCAPK